MVARRSDRTVEDDRARQLAETTDNDNHAPDPPPPEDDAPLGWERLIPGRRVFRLSSSHPDFPTEWLAKYRHDEYQRLTLNGAVGEAVKRLRQYWINVEPIMLVATTTAEVSKPCLDLLHALDAETDSLPISDRTTRRIYLAEHAFPELIARLLIVLTEPRSPIPIEVLVNAETAINPDADPVTMALRPGEIVIRLSDTPVRHLRQEFLTFVSEAQQEILGHQQRTRPVNAEKAISTFLLRKHTDLTAEEITGGENDRSNSRSAVQKRTQRRQRRAKQQGEAWTQEATQAANAWLDFLQRRNKTPTVDNDGR
ncbi:MAG: hypothetical protein M3Q03_00810 [Chloroflexota bacterium]|nr:hypothetical protein [Chloroflexota bacterium]